MYKTIKKCRICKHNNLKSVLDLESQPPANSLYLKGDDPAVEVALRLLYCHNCSTVQLGEDVNPNYLFNNYLWVSGTASGAEKYSYQFVKKALKKIEGLSSEKPYVIEIASNDGTFLKRFIDSNCKVLGIDPAKNIAELANNNGIPTIAEFFTLDLANELIGKDGKADMIFARNVIPHVKEIHSVIAGISALLKNNGVGIIEFHNANLILEEVQYDYIYHEHLFYFTLKTMSDLLERHGLFCYDLSSSPISGGSWVVYFSKNKKLKSKKILELEAKELHSEINSYDHWLLFSENVKKHAEKLKKLVNDNDNKIIAYGASARSSTLLNFCGINSDQISVIIDKNPLKQGLLTAGSNIPIVSLEDCKEELKSATKILLLAWNFKEEIIDELKSLGFTGEFIIPLPGDPRIISTIDKIDS